MHVKYTDSSLTNCEFVVFYNAYNAIAMLYIGRGTFSQGVANGASICAPGYEICPSASRAGSLGLTSTTCGSSITANDDFYASLQSSDGLGQCGSSGNDDIWGCAQNDPSNPVGTILDPQVSGCANVLIAVLSTDLPIAGWDAGIQNTELTTASLTDRNNGGVLCCKAITSDPTSEPTSEPTVATGNPTTGHPTYDPTMDLCPACTFGPSDGGEDCYNLVPNKVYAC